MGFSSSLQMPLSAIAHATHTSKLMRWEFNYVACFSIHWANTVQKCFRYFSVAHLLPTPYPGSVRSHSATTCTVSARVCVCFRELCCFTVCKWRFICFKCKILLPLWDPLSGSNRACYMIYPFLGIPTILAQGFVLLSRESGFLLLIQFLI